MDKIKDILKYIGNGLLALIVVILIIWIWRSCGKEGSNDNNSNRIEITDTVTTVETDTVTYTEVDTVHEPVYITDTVKIPKGIDTVEVLKDYYAKKFFSDTLISDSAEVEITINDTISNNTIAHREVQIKNNRLSTTTYELTEKDGTEIYTGFDIGGNREFFQVSPTATVIVNDRWSVGLRYSIRKRDPNAIFIKVERKLWEFHN